MECATIPPEFLTAMEKEREGISLLKERHQKTVYELTENWYTERLNRLLFIKQLEINKISISVDNSNGSGKIEVLKKVELIKIDKQFSDAITLTTKIRNLLIEGYSDTNNWEKLVKLNAINLEMTRSLTELNAAQRKFYSDLAGKNTPFPSDFINQQTQNLLKN
jgi:hypothetical protein